MRNSRRIKRMSRNRGKISKMNLTSLMDVFTILVFFLLVNSGSVEVLDAPKDVTLPESRVIYVTGPDGVEAAARAGATAIAQPGGSARDEEAIAAANRLGVAMIFTGARHFRH